MTSYRVHGSPVVTTLRLPKPLFDRIAQVADELDRSRHWVMIESIRRGMGVVVGETSSDTISAKETKQHGRACRVEGCDCTTFVKHPHLMGRCRCRHYFGDHEKA